MKRQAVESTTIRSVGYNRANQVLELEFQSGAVYHYFDVPPSIHERLLKASSKGRYFNDEIRDDYDCIRVNQRGRAASAR